MTAVPKPEHSDSVVSELASAREPASGTEKAVRPPRSIWERAVYRWMAITLVMGVLLIVYTQHPYYRQGQFAPFRPAYTAAFVVWLTLGLFYVKATLTKFGSLRYLVRDAGLHLLLLAKALSKGRFWRTAKNRRVRTTLLGIVVKGFFTPLMTGFFAGHMNSVSRAWLQHKHLPALDFKVAQGTNVFATVAEWWRHVGVRLPDLVPSAGDFTGFFQPWHWSRTDFSWGLGVAYDLIFIVDCGWALFGYATESRWLGNKTRSVEPTAFGWAVCLACYPPFNNVLGTYLPLETGAGLIKSDNILVALRAVTVLLFAIYASATVAFGFKFSNLTNRGIVQRGPYRFVRHPAYLCKCTAWWLEHLPTMTITKAFFLTLLCGVYALRAWTEERHLGRDPDYRAYKAKVRWVLLPGVF